VSRINRFPLFARFLLSANVVFPCGEVLDRNEQLHRQEGGLMHSLDSRQRFVRWFAFAVLALTGVAAITASTAARAGTIVGGWADAFGAINFLPDGQYMDIEIGTPDPLGHPGIERGTYTWNSGNGALLNQPGLDTNGNWGLSDPPCQPPSTCVATVSGGVLIFEFVNPPNDSEEVTLDSVKAWYLEDSPTVGDLIVFDLLANGAFFMAIDPLSTGYYVYGFYDSLTGALTAQQTDLPGGLASAPNHASFSGNDLILTTADGEQLTLRSIQSVPEPTEISLLGLGLFGLAVMRRARRSIPGKA
jgi:hypothetical protein